MRPKVKESKHDEVTTAVGSNTYRRWVAIISKSELNRRERATLLHSNPRKKLSRQRERRQHMSGAIAENKDKAVKLAYDSLEDSKASAGTPMPSEANTEKRLLAYKHGDDDARGGG